MPVNNGKEGFSTIPTLGSVVQDFKLDPFDPINRAFIVIDNIIYVTTNFSSEKPSWVCLFFGFTVGNSKGGYIG